MRTHSFSAYRLALISAVSLRCSAEWCTLSSLRSLPAQSTSVRRPVKPPPFFKTHVNRSTAWDRELAALQCVADVALRDLPAAMIASSSFAVLTSGSTAPMSWTSSLRYSDASIGAPAPAPIAPPPTSLSAISGRDGESKSVHRFPAISKYATRTETAPGSA
jgi:hypothetical protein